MVALQLKFLPSLASSAPVPSFPSEQKLLALSEVKQGQPAQGHSRHWGKA